MHIKVLQTLRGFAPRGTIDIKVLKDLKTASRKLSSAAWRGTGPRPTVKRSLLRHRSARACPSRTFIATQARRGRRDLLVSTHKNAPITVARGPVPRDRSITVARRTCPRDASRCLNQDSQDSRICWMLSFATAKSLLKKTALQVL